MLLNIPVGESVSHQGLGMYVRSKQTLLGYGNREGYFLVQPSPIGVEEMPPMYDGTHPQGPAIYNTK